MKKAIFALCCTGLVWAGCREKNTPVIFPDPVPANTDSSYVLAAGAIPATTHHNVLIEEFTGQSCSNCVPAHALLDAIAAQYPGRVNIVSMYASNPHVTQLIPPDGAKYDFRNDTALAIQNKIYTDYAGLPSAGVDRTPFLVSGVMTYAMAGSGSWSLPVALQQNMPDSVNLGISSSYNAAKGIYTITDTVIYTGKVNSHQNVSIFIVEDKLTDFQEEFQNGFTVTDSTYQFNDVFMAMITTLPLGDAVLDAVASKPAGQVYWRKYTFSTAGTRIVNPANCRVIAFVNNQGTGGDYRVLQSVQCKLVP